MDERPRYSLRQLAAAGQAETLLATDLDLPHPAATVREVRRTVLIDSACAAAGHAILSGRLRLDYIYTVSQNRSRSGPLHSHTLETALAVAIPADGAAPGMELTLLEAHVTGADIIVTARQPEGMIRSLRDLSLVRLSVRLWRETYASALPPAGRQAPQSAQAVLSRFQARGKKK